MRDAVPAISEEREARFGQAGDDINPAKGRDRHRTAKEGESAFLF